MTKILSFSCVEKLGMLLDPKIKVIQTLRPAWSKIIVEEDAYEGNISGANWEETINKPARFMKGESVQLFWKAQDYRHQHYCKLCGSGLGTPEKGCISSHSSKSDVFFYKKLGCGMISEEPFLITLSKTKRGHWEAFREDGWDEFGKLKGLSEDMDGGSNALDLFARMDGFRDHNEFFSYFDKHYDLSIGKSFWCYRVKKE